MADKATIIRALVLLDSKPDDVLKHYGVMGMRWGVRRSRRSGGGRLTKTPTGAKKTVTTELTDHEHAMVLKKRGAKDLTSAELKALNNRLQLEKTYKELTNKPGRIKNAETILKRTVDLAKTVEQMDRLYNSPTGQKIRKTVESQLKHTPKVVK